MRTLKVFLMLYIAALFLLCTAIVFAQDKSKNYLPLISNDAGNTETPTHTLTVTPTSTLTCPQTGLWMGTTDKEGAISLSVSANQNCQVENLVSAFPVICASDASTFVTSVGKTFPAISIVDNHFDSGESDLGRVMGDFTSSGMANGEWSFSGPVLDADLCSGNGTWTANHVFPSPLTKLYLRFGCGPNENEKCLSLVPERDFAIQSFNFTNIFSTTLIGDISGGEYGFSLVLGTSSSVQTYTAEILIGNQVVASTEFNIDSNTFQRYTKIVTGSDPLTQAGDTLLVRVKKLRGGGELMVGAPPNQDSFIIIPGVDIIPTSTPTTVPTNAPTFTSTPAATATDTPTNTSTPRTKPTGAAVPATATPTETLTPTPSHTPAATATNTPNNTSTPTPTLTSTPFTGYDGNWSGMTSQDLPVSVAIQNAKVTSLTVEFQKTDLLFTCTYTLDHSTATPITGNTFQVAGQAGNIIVLPFITYTITGTFNSNTSVSGNLQMTVDDILCNGDVNATWTATKQ